LRTTTLLINSIALLALLAPGSPFAGPCNNGVHRYNPHCSGGPVPPTPGGNTPTATGPGGTGAIPPMPTQLAPTKGKQKTPTAVAVPLLAPSLAPDQAPVATPVAVPGRVPQAGAVPGQVPTAIPSQVPVAVPGRVPQPVAVPGQVPTAIPSQVPVAVPGRVPQPVSVPGQVPTAIPSQVPVAVPGRMPQPVAVPGQVPSAIPPQVPVAVPGRAPTMRPDATHVAIPGHRGTVAGNPGEQAILMRPVPRPNSQRIQTATTPATATHHETHRSQPRKHRDIAISPGRHDQHDLPAFRDAGTGDEWRCAASGFGQRRPLPTERGALLSAGALRHLGSVDALARDVPARHPEHAGCIIAVKRRDR